jgi:hypothetical protein
MNKQKNLRNISTKNQQREELGEEGDPEGEGEVKILY